MSQCANVSFGQDIFDEASGKNVKQIDSLDLPEWLAEQHGIS